MFKKVYKFEKLHDIDIAITINSNERYFSYSFFRNDAWPPSMEAIVC